MAFLDDTIYTNHALNKICENLIGDYSNFNFLKIKIGSGDNTLSLDRPDLTYTLYSLRIKNVTYADGVISIICEIPPELANVPITEIGLFDTVLGVDYLFSYSKVDIVKPADLGYELTIVLNLGPRTIDFPGVNEIGVKDVDYATAEDLENFINTFIYVETNLERAIYKNADKLGKNLAEVTYEEQLDIRNTLKNTSFANLYSSLYNLYGEELINLYFISEPNYLSYDILNMVDPSEYLTTYLGLFEANDDSISFHNGAITLAWLMQLEDLSTASTIFNKLGDTYLYFSVDTQQNYEIYKVEKAETATVPTYHQALYNELVFTFYGLSGTYTIKYIFDETDKGLYMGQQTPYMLSFNGDFADPAFHLFVDGTEVAEADEPSEFDSQEVQEARQESDLYGKVKFGSATELIDMPDYSRICRIKNYLLNSETEEKYNYTNALNTSLIMAIKKQVDNVDVALINNILRQFGESVV